MISTLVIGSLRSPPPYPAAPDFPLCRGQNKTPQDNLLINPPLEMTVLADPYRHFDHSGAEWRNLTPQMAEKPACSPLEMTMGRSLTVMEPK